MNLLGVKVIKLENIFTIKSLLTNRLLKFEHAVGKLLEVYQLRSLSRRNVTESKRICRAKASAFSHIRWSR